MWMISYRYAFRDHIGLKSLKKPPSRRKRNDGSPHGRTKKEREWEEKEKEGACFWRETDPALNSTSLTYLLT